MSYDAIESSARQRAYDVRLFGGFRLTCAGRAVGTLPSAQRVVALLALADRDLPRAYVAATLWPETTDRQAGANLRTALWRLGDRDHDVVAACCSHLRLRPDVAVDVRSVAEAARRHRLTGEIPGAEILDLTGGELLPGCWDSWLVFERERLRQEVIHLLHVLADAALRRRDPHLAVLAALSAVERDPLREASNALLVRAHVADGSPLDAGRAYRHYAALLRAEIGVEPTATMRRLGASVDPRWLESVS